MKPTYTEQCLERAEKAFVSKWGRTNDGEFLADSLQDVVELATRLSGLIEAVRIFIGFMGDDPDCRVLSDLCDELEAIPGDK